VPDLAGSRYAAEGSGPPRGATNEEVHLKRFSPAAVLVMAAALILVVDAVILVAPNVLADPSATGSPAASSAGPGLLADATPTRFFDDPTWFPATTANAYIGTPTPGPATPTPVPTAKPKPAPTYRDTVANARTYVKGRVGAAGYDCINAVWTAESGWNPLAGNSSGAYGIPQAKPGSKMATFGSNWRTSPLTQVKWGLWYVTNKYKSACGAYDFWQAHGWY
jgi:hypothetical protein